MPPFRRRFFREVAILFGFLLLTVVMTWPWARHIRDTAPDWGDPYLNSWILWWDFHQTFHDPLRLFQGNVFYPYHYSLAFSEHNYGLALPLFPLFALGLRPLTAQGLLTLLAFALSGYGAFRLTRTLTGSTGASWVAGIGFAFVPYRFQHLSHVNYLFTAWIPLTLEALVLYLRKPDRRRAVWLGATFFLNGLSVIHWFVLSLVPLALTGLWLAARSGRDVLRDLLPKAAAAIAVAGLLLLPFFVPYARVWRMYGMSRSAGEALGFSAMPHHWLTSEPGNRLWHGLGENPPPGELSLFPGLLLILLSAAAILIIRKDERPAPSVAGAVPLIGRRAERLSENAAGAASPPSASTSGRVLLTFDVLSAAVATFALFASNIEPLRVSLFGREILRASSPARALAILSVLLGIRWCLAWPRAFFWVRHANLRESLRHGTRGDAIVIGLICLVTGFFGSFGMRFWFHRALHELVPLFRSIRAPARWAMVADLGLALLAGVGALAIAEAWQRRRSGSRHAGTIVCAGACALLLFEHRVAPLSLFRGKADPDGLTRKLATLSMRGGLVELPSGQEPHGNYEYVLRAADHGKPLVNGVSGFGVPIVQRIEELTARSPIPDELFDLLESIPVSYVTVREGWLEPSQRTDMHDFLRRGLDEGRLVYVGRFDPATQGDLWAVTKTEPSAASDTPPRWRLEGPKAALESIVKDCRRDDLLGGGLDDFPADGVVRAPLVVRGWARIPGEDLEVRVLIDGEERDTGPAVRYARPDVSSTLPQMGDCSKAGFEFRFGPEKGDDGQHEITAIFFSRDGRCRIYPPARLTWTP